MDVVAVYVGKDGAHLIGIPARDLTPDDWAALSEEAQAAVRACGLYAFPPPAAPVVVAEVVTTEEAPRRRGREG